MLSRGDVYARVLNRGIALRAGLMQSKSCGAPAASSFVPTSGMTPPDGILPKALDVSKAVDLNFVAAAAESNSRGGGGMRPKAGRLHLAAIMLAHLACMSQVVWLSPRLRDYQYRR